jgi:hypothetical protein
MAATGNKTRGAQWGWSVDVEVEAKNRKELARLEPLAAI